MCYLSLGLDRALSYSQKECHFPSVQFVHSMDSVTRRNCCLVHMILEDYY